MLSSTPDDLETLSTSELEERKKSLVVAIEKRAKPNAQTEHRGGDVAPDEDAADLVERLRELEREVERRFVTPNKTETPQQSAAAEVGAARGGEQEALMVFAEDALERHVAEALRIAQAIAGERPVDAVCVLHACALLTKRRRGQISEAFTFWGGLVPALASRGGVRVDADKDWFRPGGFTVKIDVGLAQSIDRLLNNLKLWRRPEHLWGRDLVTAALLAADEESLAGLVMDSGRSPSSVLGNWYEFVAGKDPRGLPPAAWDSLWLASSVPLPNVAMPGGGGERFLGPSRSGQRISIRHVERKPWAIGVDAFVIPMDRFGRVGSLADSLQQFVGEELFRRMLSDVVPAIADGGEMTAESPVAVPVPPSLQAAGLPSLLILATSRQARGRSSQAAGIAVVAACELAAKHGVRRLGSALIGAGSGGLAPNEVVEAVASALNQCQLSTPLETVVLTTLDRALIKGAKNERAANTVEPATAAGDYLSQIEGFAQRIAKKVGLGVADSNCVLVAQLLASAVERAWLLERVRLSNEECIFEGVKKRWHVSRSELTALQSQSDLEASPLDATAQSVLAHAKSMAASAHSDTLPDGRALILAALTPLPGTLEVPAERLVRWLDLTPGEVATTLGNWLREEQTRAGLSKLATEWSAEPSPVPARLGLFSSYTNDRLASDDQLGIEDDVAALADVIAAHSRKPPLAVGLFGDWGTGKSFFIRSLQTRLNELQACAVKATAEGAATAYCKHIVHVEFNAWQYVDGNTWANLVHRILHQMSDALAIPNENDKNEERRKKLFMALQLANEQIAERERAKRALQDSKDALGRRLSELEEELGAQQKELAGSVTLSDLQRLALQDPEVAKSVEAFKAEWQTLALGSEIDEVLRAKSELSGIVGRFVQAWRWWSAPPRGKQLLAAALLFVSVVAHLALPKLEELYANLRPYLLVVGAWIATAVTWAKQFMPLIRQADRALSRATAAQTAIDRMIEAKRQEQEVAKRAVLVKVESIGAQLASNAAEQHALETQIRQIEAEIEETSRGGQLRQFIRDRSSSDDYHQHLGIVATIREDFARLQGLVEALCKSDECKGIYPIDRVVLYVDDLDRCPADRVVEILQAVHLLLDFELFVAVIAVDPRWLLRSLEHHYRNELGFGVSERNGSGRGLWASSPQDFLEKIFQIPFALRPMQPAGYSRLVQSLVPVQVPSGSGRAVSTDPGERGAAAESVTRGQSNAETGAAAEAVVRRDAVATHQAQAPANTVGTVRTGDIGRESMPKDPMTNTAKPAVAGGNERTGLNPNPAGLQVEQHERELMEKLACVVVTPRSTKRLVNLYYLVRAMLHKHELDAFVGTPDDPGTCGVHLFMLGIMVSCPVGTEMLLERIFADTEQSIEEVLAKLDPVAQSQRHDMTATSWATVHPCLRRLVTEMRLPSRIWPYREAANRIARFSFRSQRFGSVELALRISEAPSA